MRAALYARVSTEEQVEGYSIDAQRRAFQTLVQGRDWIAIKEYLEEGRSARTEDISKRPVFKEMIADALAWKFDVLVVHKLDRFSRNLRITLEYFDKLLKAGVAFISINEQMDFTTPSGKVHLALLGAFAQYYSDNLSQETKKGWAERRAQGLYCGLLPFGAMKGEEGVPVPDTWEIHLNGRQTCNYEGLQLAFQEGANGKSNRQVAMLLNAQSYRTTGSHGHNPFSTDTVKDMLKNRFYLGELPDGKGGWIKGKHQPLISAELFEAAERTRERNTNRPKNIRSDAKPCSLSGVARCTECGANLRAFHGANGRIRLMCNTRIKGGNCSQKSAYLDIYEEQLQAYLEAFHIPEDESTKLLDSYQHMTGSSKDDKAERAKIETRLERIKDLYSWGDMSKTEYLAQKRELKRRLVQLTPATADVALLDKLAQFLNSVAFAWREADQEHRNQLAHRLFDAVWIENQKVLAVTPRPEFEPFFDMEYRKVSRDMLQWRP